MAATPQTSFAVDAAVGTNFGFASTTTALPGTPASDACVRVANLGPCHISVKLGIVSTTVTQSTGLVVMAGETVYLTIGAATHIAGAAAGGPGNTSTVNLATGN